MVWVTDRSLEANLWRYRGYNAVVFTPFMIPTIVLFWQDCGLDMTQVYLLQGLFAVGVVLLEVPTGMVADRIGKRASLLGCSSIAACCMTLYALSSGFWGFLAAELGLALAISLYSGADSALLYDTLERLDRTDEYTRREGDAKATQMVSFAASALIGGVIGAYSFRVALWMSLLGPVLSFFVALGMVEAGQHAETSVREAISGYRDLVGSAWTFVRKHRMVQWQIAWLAVLSGSSTWLLWMYQPYMQHVGFPLWAFGIAFAGFNLFAAASSKKAHDVATAAGDRGILWLLAALQVFPLLLLAWVTGLFSWMFIFGQQAVRGIARPVISARILEYTWADKRSTVLSFAGLAGRLFFAVTAIPVGLAAEYLPMDEALLFQAFLLVLCLGGLLLARERIPSKYERVKPEAAG